MANLHGTPRGVRVAAKGKKTIHKGKRLPQSHLPKSARADAWKHKGQAQGQP